VPAPGRGRWSRRRGRRRPGRSLRDRRSGGRRCRAEVEGVPAERRRDGVGRGRIVSTGARSLSTVSPTSSSSRPGRHGSRRGPRILGTGREGSGSGRPPAARFGSGVARLRLGLGLGTATARALRDVRRFDSVDGGVLARRPRKSGVLARRPGKGPVLARRPGRGGVARRPRRAASSLERAPTRRRADAPARTTPATIGRAGSSPVPRPGSRPGHRRARTARSRW
jgi:hypothetical protein